MLAHESCPLPTRRELRQRTAKPTPAPSTSPAEHVSHKRISSVFPFAKAGVLGALAAITVVIPLSGFVSADASLNIPTRTMGVAAGTSWADAGQTRAASSLAGSDTAASRARARAPLTVTACVPAQTAANGERTVTVDDRTVYMPIQAGHYQSTSPFGPRVNPVTGGFEFHTGTDMAAPMGTPIHSIYSGVVVKVGWDSWSGNYVKIRHEFSDGTVFYSMYLHQYANQILVSEGEAVAAGQVIGAVGSNGMSTGAHLHLEIHNAADDEVDPDAWLAANGAIDIAQEACS